MAGDPATVPAHDARVFAPYCDACERRVLLGPRRIERFTTSPDGHDVQLRCWCGALVAWDAAAPAALEDAG